MRHLCTYFDRRYLTHGLALYRSLVRHAQPFTLHVLCLDEATLDCLQRLRLPGVNAIALSAVEKAHPALVIARGNRSPLEYYFTLTPAFPRYLLDEYPDIDVLGYVEADVYFYSSLEPVYAELGDGSILLVPHRLSASIENRTGTFNVGLLLFRNDPAGRASLDWWRERCVEWCYDRMEDGKCADQGYLDDWPTRFRGVVVASHRGVGLAPWNVAEQDISLRDGAVSVGDVPLVFYHFAGVRLAGRRVVTHTLPGYRARMTRALRQHVYVPYVRELLDIGAHAQLPLPGDSLPSNDSLTLATRIRHELFRGRLIIVGDRCMELDYGSVGPLAAWIGRSLFAREHG
jgi:hypothetical protein